PKDDLNQNELSLLNTFLSPYNIKFPILTNKEKKWKQIINNSAHEEMKGFYRFVFFSIQQHQIDPISFKEAIQELFPNQIPILWENDHEGIIVEEREKNEEPIVYKQIIDLLMSDLYVKIKFFVGPFRNNLDHVKQHHLSIIKDAQTAFNYSKKEVITYSEAIPFLLIDQVTDSFKKDMSKLILQDYVNDQETLQMIKTFVECNLNISETAKELYMHRNSLQYRLDKFQEKTGLDIRKFHDAMTVYLALIAND